MDRYIPYEKMSKKEQKKYNALKRGNWGQLNPVTRKPQNSKAYNRKKALRMERDYHEPIEVLFSLQFSQ